MKFFSILTAVVIAAVFSGGGCSLWEATFEQKKNTAADVEKLHPGLDTGSAGKSAAMPLQSAGTANNRTATVTAERQIFPFFKRDTSRRPSMLTNDLTPRERELYEQNSDRSQSVDDRSFRERSKKSSEWVFGL